jgi:hypothetical protein
VVDTPVEHLARASLVYRAFHMVHMAKYLYQSL